MAPQRIGVFGGTFDPPHIGHLIVAHDVIEALHLDRMILVPAGNPPHKPPSDGYTPSAAEVRLAMVRAAVEGDPVLEVDDLEVRREGPSYTVDTLREFRGRWPEAKLFVVIGVDQLEELHTWRAPEELERLATLVVLAREGQSPPSDGFRAQVAFDLVPHTRVDLSSTAIRRRVREGYSIRYRVAEATRRILVREGLYNAPEPIRNRGAGG